MSHEELLLRIELTIQKLEGLLGICICSEEEKKELTEIISEWKKIRERL